MGVFYRYQDSGLDDWKKENNYLQMGFRPGFAIQARELTQLQTVFQNQLNAIAKKVGINHGTIIDAETIVTAQGADLWSISIGQGDIWIQPELRDFGFSVTTNSLLQLSNISANPAKKTIVYLIFEELQVNPNGQEFTPQGGFSGVVVDNSLNDNAQGFTNSSAPGASRYHINIKDIAYRVEGETNAPPNSVDVAFFENGFPYYSVGGAPITY